jgi:hypothetical protein
VTEAVGASSGADRPMAETQKETDGRDILVYNRDRESRAAGRAARPASVEGTDMSDDRVEEDGSRFAVLEVFGLKLEVSNPALAELLTMDAKDALTTDVRDLGSSKAVFEFREEAAQAAPEVVLAPPTAKDDQDAALRREYRSKVSDIGSALGFEATPDGIWRSPAGITILTRAIDRGVSLAAATHWVTELAARREQLAGPGASVLFIVDGQQSADVFKVAIRQQALYDVMRVISVDNLQDVRRLLDARAIDHAQAVILLAPSAAIDVGEILSVIRAASESGEGGPTY